LVCKKPDSVLHALRTVDRAALSALGRMGAEKLKRNRSAEALRKENQKLRGSRQSAIEANEHICPIE